MSAPALTRPLRRLALATAATAALAGLPGTASAFSSLFVFGDSLSDAAGGNNAFPLAPNEGGLLIPGPYDNGRVSNGPVAAEHLGSLLGLSAAQQFQYAIAGARTGLNGVYPSTGLLTQVGVFAMGGANPFYGSGLSMVWAGSNDLRDALVSQPDPSTQFSGIIGNLESAITTLYGLGARSFLLPNIPDLGLTPEVLAMGTAASVGASMVTMSFNDLLAASYADLAAGLPGAAFYTFNTFEAHHALLADAAGHNLQNLTNGCLVPTAGAAQDPSDCSVSFFVDNIHPTTQVHQVLAEGMAAAVPEPATMLTMGLGVLALLGVSARRRVTRG